MDNKRLQQAMNDILAQLVRPLTPLQLRRMCLTVDAALFDAALQLLLQEEKLVQQPDGNLARA
jgi:hypothetical protein